jgi:hypothetical protein
MASWKLELRNVGQISHAELDFGDLTVLVGPQATGKSILLQFLRLLLDPGHVLAELKKYGLDWKRDRGQFLDAYFGEGMQSIWREHGSRATLNGTEIDLDALISRQRKNKEESVFFIPAQRVLTLGRGWPRPFTDYSPGDPFAVRDFSEKLRLLLDSEIGSGENLFPRSGRLKKEYRDILGRTVFSGFGLQVDRYKSQKRLVLTDEHKRSSPFMVWSAGQREFVPLLLGFYWLLPSTKMSRRAKIEWVIIEELEMGLHPQAISVVLLLVMELLSRGYRVCLSTHSPHVLDVVWALRTIREHDADPAKLLELFGVAASQQVRSMAEELISKEARVFYFDRESEKTRDISDLDPGADDAATSGWGGLTEFSGRVSDLVADVVAASR